MEDEKQPDDGQIADTEFQLLAQQMFGEWRAQHRQQALQNSLWAEHYFVADVHAGKKDDALKWLDCKALPPRSAQREYALSRGIAAATRRNNPDFLRTLIAIAKQEELDWQGSAAEYGKARDVRYGQKIRDWGPLTEVAADCGSDKVAEILLAENVQLRPKALLVLLGKGDEANDAHKAIAQLYLDAGVSTKEKVVVGPSSFDDFAQSILFFTPLAPFMFIAALCGLDERKPDTSLYDYAKKLPDNPIAKIIIDHVRKAYRPAAVARRIFGGKAATLAPVG